MNVQSRLSSREEWARSLLLPFVCSLGVAGSILFPMLIGVLLLPLTEEFGWTRAQVSVGSLVQMPVGLVAAIFFSRLVDKRGPRPVLLVGLPVSACGFALMASISGVQWQWWLLSALLGLAIAPALPIAWVAAVVSRFDTARGTALAVTLSGVGLGTAIWPVLGALVSQEFGWRAVLPVLGIGWALLVWPLAYFTLPRDRSEQANAVGAEISAGQNFANVLRTRVFWSLTIAGSLFIAAVHGLNLNLVPILQGYDYSLPAAAGIAGLAGLSAIAGRLVTGILLDSVPIRPLALGAFLLPLIAIALFMAGGGTGWLPVSAVVLLGLSLGSETDIIAYVASRRFDQNVFAFAYSICVSAFSISSAIGPFVANRIFDAYGSYVPYFIGAVPIIILGSIFIATIPRLSAESS